MTFKQLITFQWWKFVSCEQLEDKVYGQTKVKR